MPDLTPALLVDAIGARAAHISGNLNAFMKRFATLAENMERQFQDGMPVGDYAGSEEISVGPLCFRLEFAEYREVPESAGRILLLRRWMSGDKDLTCVRAVVPMMAREPAGIESAVVARLLPGFLRDLSRQFERRTPQRRRR